MNAEKETLAIKYMIKFSGTKIGGLIFPNHTNKFLFVFLLSMHSIYWLTASWSPLPFLASNLLGIYVGGGIFKPWGIIINQGMNLPKYDLNVLKIGLPFIALNWIAIFACLYMYGTVLENGVPIAGTWKHFYFSAITLTTIGYGNIVPSGYIAEALAVIEALAGFVGFSIIVGIVTSITIKRSGSGNVT
jgi:hypothetical protein